MSIAPVAPPPRVRTRSIPDPGPLIERLPDENDPLCWVRGSDGLVGWGEVARLRVRGRDRFEAADAWWRGLVSRLRVTDEVGVPGTGPVPSSASPSSPTRTSRCWWCPGWWWAAGTASAGSPRSTRTAARARAPRCVGSPRSARPAGCATARGGCRRGGGGARWPRRCAPRVRQPALRLIAELEEMDRGRYAGPVGWVDASGDGELGLALRCALLSGSTARLFGGGGIVADSDPDTEVAEVAAKMLAVRSALAGHPRRPQRESRPSAH